MFDFIYDIIQALVDFLVYLWDMFVGFFQSLGEALWGMIYSILPSSVTDGTLFGVDYSIVGHITGAEDNQLTNLDAGLIDFLFWMFPIYQCITMVVLAYTCIGAIRLVRHLLGLIPTTNLG